MSIQRQTIQRILSDPHRCQDVVAHRLIFCEVALASPPDERILECECCRRFLAYCCACTERRRTEDECSPYFSEDPDFYKPCHHYKIAFVDGACLGNGQEGATAGIGIAIGAKFLTMQWALPIDDLVDPVPTRTSQRAELLAAINGIRKLGEYEGSPVTKSREGRANHTSGSREKDVWVITSDSEYVVSGMTEWVPAWKNNGWRNSSKKRPKNLDLFQTLHTTVEQYEREYKVQIAFWRIGREYNTIADSLAGIAARGQTLEENLQAYVDPACFSRDESDTSLVRLLPCMLHLSDVSFLTVDDATTK
ncbi:Ribonuclease H-like domain containing protein [Tylopilus felleus]